MNLNYRGRPFGALFVIHYQNELGAKNVDYTVDTAQVTFCENYCLQILNYLVKGNP